jgi:hypothetical protein
MRSLARNLKKSIQLKILVLFSDHVNTCPEESRGFAVFSDSFSVSSSTFYCCLGCLAEIFRVCCALHNPRAKSLDHLFAGNVYQSSILAPLRLHLRDHVDERLKGTELTR